jgi:hypothetical protein
LISNAEVHFVWFSPKHLASSAILNQDSKPTKSLAKSSRREIMKLFLCASALSLSTLFASCAPNTAATSSISSEPASATSTPASATVSVPVTVLSESFDQLETSALQDQWRTEIGDVQRKGKYFDGPGEVGLSITAQSFDGALGKALSLNYGLLLCSGTYPKINRKNGCERHADAVMDFSSEQKSKMNEVPTINAKLKLNNSVVKFRSNGTYRNEDLKPLDGNAVLSLEVTDSKGNIFAYQLQNIKNGWQNIQVDLNDAPTSRRGNASNGNLVMPLRSMAMVVNQPGVKGFDEAVGYLLVDDLNITSGSASSNNNTEMASTPAASNLAVFEFARFGVNPAFSLQGGSIARTQYSERPGDAEVQNVSTDSGFVTADYTLSRQNGSTWGGAGLLFLAGADKTANVQGFNAVRLQIAASKTSQVFVRIAGNEDSISNNGCYPILFVDVKPELKTYVLPLKAFSNASYCAANSLRTMTQTINAGVRYVEVTDGLMPDSGTRRGQLKVGAIEFIR